MYPALFRDYTDEDTGLVEKRERLIYMEGDPRIHTFSGKTGRFGLLTTDPLAKEHKETDSLVIRPMTYRCFTGSVFTNDDPNKQFAELFFVDEKGCISMILFNQSSKYNFINMLRRLGPLQRPLTELRLTITVEKVTNPKGNYYAAKFEAEYVDSELEKSYRRISKMAARFYSVYSYATAEKTTQTELFGHNYPIQVVEGIQARRNRELELARQNRELE